MFPWQQKQGAMTFKSRPLFISLPYVFTPGDNREIEKCPQAFSCLQGFYYTSKKKQQILADVNVAKLNYGYLQEEKSFKIIYISFNSHVFA